MKIPPIKRGIRKDTGGGLKIGPIPGSNQVYAYYSDADEVLFTGGVGTGKTTAIYNRLIYGGVQQYDPVSGKLLFNEDGSPFMVPAFMRPDYVALIVKPTYKSIKATFEDKFKEFVLPIIPEAVMTWGDGMPQLKIGGRTIIDFLSMSTDESVRRAMGSQYSKIYFDEAGTINYEYMTALKTRCRNAHGGIHCQVFYTSNPVGRSKDWLKRRFVDVCPPKKTTKIYEPRWDITWTKTVPGDPVKTMVGDSGEYTTVQHISSFILENTPMVTGSPQVITAWAGAAKKDPLFDRLYFHDDWSATIGSFFPMWDPLKHVLYSHEFDYSRLGKEPRKKLYVGVDFGTFEKTVFSFLEFNEDSGMGVVFDELVITGNKPDFGATNFKFSKDALVTLGAVGHAKMAQEFMFKKYGLILHPTGYLSERPRHQTMLNLLSEKEGQPQVGLFLKGDFSRIYADPAIWTKASQSSGNMLSPGQMMFDAGLPIFQDPNIIRDRSTNASALYHVLLDNNNGIPNLRFTDRCEYLISSLPGLERDECSEYDWKHSGSEKGEDHGGDSLKYMMPIVYRRFLLRDSKPEQAEKNRERIVRSNRNAASARSLYGGYNG